MQDKKSVLDNQFVFTVLAILLGLIVGALVLLFSGFNPLDVYRVLIEGIVSKPKYVAYDIIYATPIILTGLSVAFAFRTGLFNIGAEGQYIMGSLAAVLVGILVSAPPVIHGLLCILAGALAGAGWAGLSGLFKSQKGISEVITGIMLNWIALYFSNFMVKNSPIAQEGADASVDILDTASIKIQALKVDRGTILNAGIFIAIVMVIVVYMIINKTTLGYQLRAVGLNAHAAQYGGINVTRSMMISMVIAGALAGLAGAVQVTGVQGRINLLASQEGYGFDGLSVAMIGANHPVGVLFSGLFFGALKYGGGKLTTVRAPSELINIIMGCIIYFTAIATGLKQIFGQISIGKGGKKS